MSTPDEKLVQKSSGSRTGMYAAIAVVIVVLLVVVVAWQAGWLTSSPKPNSNGTTSCTPPTPETVTGSGSTFVYPLMFTWESAYTHSTVQYGSVGSGAGISALTQKTVDFGASDAPLSPAQQAALPGKVVTIPETAGGVAIIYNLPGVGAKVNFTGAILAQVYLGNITQWNDAALQAANPNVSLPNQAIIVVHRQDGSGTSFAFTDFLTKSSSYWASNVGKSTLPVWPTGVAQKGSGAMATFVQSTPYTVGYVDLSYALTNGIQFGAVKNPAGANIVPTLADTASAVHDGATTLPLGDDMPGWYNVSLINQAGATDYPITTFSYLMVYEQLDTVYGSAMTMNLAENLVNFLNWTITYGQSSTAQLYYVTLPANVVTADQASIQLVTYGAHPVPVCTAK